MIVILLGAPGSGKGTQSERLAGRFGFVHLATGDLLRAEIAAGSAVGRRAEPYVKGGKLVPDDVIIEMVAGKVEPGGKYLLDGFPRTVDQAQALDGILKRGGSSVALVASLTLSAEEAIRRMTSRRICSQCAAVYNAVSRPTRVEGVCDKCGGKVVQREDDSEATARRRLMVFEDQTQPLVAYYKGEQILTEIDASGALETVEAALAAAIEKIQVPR
jgi:adenylate kinase